MSLAAGPGRGGGASAAQLPDELQLVVDKHVAYVQSLDTVRQYSFAMRLRRLTLTCSSAETNSNTISRNIFASAAYTGAWWPCIYSTIPRHYQEKDFSTLSSAAYMRMEDLARRLVMIHTCSIPARRSKYWL